MKDKTSIIILFFTTLLVVTGCNLNLNKIKLEDINGTWKRQTIYGEEIYIFSDEGKFTYIRTSENGENDINLDYEYKLIYGDSGDVYIEIFNCSSKKYDKYCPMFAKNIPIDIINGNLNFTGDPIIILEKQSNLK